MSPATVWNLVSIVTAILKNHLTGKAGDALDSTDLIVKLIKAGNDAYEEQVGQPLDPSLIRPQ